MNSNVRTIRDMTNENTFTQFESGSTIGDRTKDKDAELQKVKGAQPSRTHDSRITVSVAAASIQESLVHLEKSVREREQYTASEVDRLAKENSVKEGALIERTKDLEEKDLRIKGLEHELKQSKINTSFFIFLTIIGFSLATVIMFI